MNGWVESAMGSAMVAAVLCGVSCGVMGAFVVVRRMALTGDMLSHAVLPGVVAGLVWSASRNPLVVLACAGAAACYRLAALLLVGYIQVLE